MDVNKLFFKGDNGLEQTTIPSVLILQDKLYFKIGFLFPSSSMIPEWT